MDRVQEFFNNRMVDSSEYMVSLVHMLMDGISDYIFLMEVVGSKRFKYALVNQSAKTRHPMADAQWEGQYIEDLLPEDKAQPLIERYQQVYEEQAPLTYEDEMDLDDTLFCGHTSLTPLKNQTGVVKYILGITRDITETVKKERDLNRINAVYRSLMENTADAILIIDQNRRIIEFNSAVETLYGFTEEDFSDHSFPFVPADKKQEADQLITEGLRNKRVAGFQTVRQHKDGTSIDVSITVSPIQNVEGDTIGVSSIIRDITDVKEDERKLTASRLRYQSLFRHNPHPILTLDLDGTVQKANPSSLKMMNTTDQELLGTSLLEWLPEEKAKWVERHCLNTEISEDICFQTDFRVGEVQRIAKVYLVPILNQTERVGLYAILDDITDREQAVEALRQSEAKFRLIADHSNDLISVFSPFGQLIYASPSIVNFLGFDPTELHGGELTTVLTEEDVAEVEKAFKQCHVDGKSFTITLKMRGESREAVWFECRGTPVLSDEGQVIRIVIVTRDISEQKKYEAKLKQIAFYDYLTGLPNRRLFEDRLNQAMLEADRRQQQFALLYLDGDGFKRINDQYGHDMGDDFLKLVGDRMNRCLRDSDSIGRIGGDEFAILLKDVQSAEHVRNIANRILNQLRKPYDLNGLDIYSSFSIGASFYPNNGSTQDDLFRTADQALYHGKRIGKGQVWLYDDL